MDGLLTPEPICFRVYGYYTPTAAWVRKLPHLPPADYVRDEFDPHQGVILQDPQGQRESSQGPVAQVSTTTISSPKQEIERASRITTST